MIKVLVPVDFSETSEKAVAYACQMFKSSQIEVTILHIFGTHSTALLMKNLDDLLLKDAKKNVSAIVEEYSEISPHVSFKTLLVKNYAIPTIVNYGNSENFDIIVMGTKGATGLKEVFLGSIAGGVISNMEAPVLVVPTDYKLSHPKRIIFAVNDKKLFEKTNLDALALIVNSNDSSSIVLHVSVNFDGVYTSDEITHGELKFSVKNAYGSGDTNKDINSFINDNEADLLCLIRGKKGFLTRILKDSVTLKQTFNSSIPLLIFQEKT